MVSLKQLYNQITKSLLCPQHTNTMVNCIGALVRQRYGDTSAIWMVEIGFCNLKYKNSKVTSGKSERKRYCNARKQGLGFILSLVQVLSTTIT